MENVKIKDANCITAGTFESPRVFINLLVVDIEGEEQTEEMNLLSIKIANLLKELEL